MPPKIGVVTFPGSLDDHDALRAVRLSGAEPVSLWHASDTLAGVDAVILPGGFSYGDYLRCGAISRFAPVMTEVIKAADRGHAGAGHLQRIPDPVRGPPAAGRADPQRRAHLRLPRPGSAGRVDRHHLDPRRSNPARQITIVLKNGEGGFVADPETLRRLEGEGQVVFRYVNGNPNGSLHDIAGICNDRGNVVGLMPHPEHNVDPLTGPTLDGRAFFASVLGFLAAKV